MREEEIISKYFSSLSAGYGEALNLEDDVAYLSSRVGRRWVVSTDTMVEGVHYLSEMSAKDVGWRLLGCAFSDIAASGATPKGFTLDLSLVPLTADEYWLEEFSRGMGEFCEKFSVGLWGGDTTVSRGNRLQVLSACVFGEVDGELGDKLPQGLAIRSGAKAGDGLYVTGFIGEARLGLDMLTNPKSRRLLHQAGQRELIKSYLRPEPRINEGISLAKKASAMMDISDGLIIDTKRMLKTSSVGGEIWLEHVPISESAASLCFRGATSLVELVTAGDDYELLISIDDDDVEELQAQIDIPLTKIGVINEGEDLNVTYDGEEIEDMKSLGYVHELL